MDQPFVGEPFPATPDTYVIPTYWPIPQVGVIPMNAFVIAAAEPVLVDTGVGVLSDDFIAALSSVISLDQLRWIWLSHDDRDHTGSLHRLLELAPRARVATPFFAIGRMLPEQPFPLDRLRLVNAGDVLNVGDRNLTAWRPPLFDSPSTAGFRDDSSGVLFTSDCFGGPLPTAEQAVVHSIAELPETTVARGQLAWATVDTPWVAMVDRHRFAASLERIRRIAPVAVLSSHLPPAGHQHVDRLLATLREAPDAPPVPGTTQTELDAMLAGFRPAEPDLNPSVPNPAEAQKELTP
jgi:glyoxylase-like metal-dependent hydrolase (beta-lactamase superfamily II)